MALALGYGILFATPLTLVLIPSLYMIGADIGGLYRKKESVDQRTPAGKEGEITPPSRSPMFL
jgi:hypothetical protein